MPTSDVAANTVVYDMDGTLFHGDCGGAFIRQRIKSSSWRLFLSLLIAPVAYPMLHLSAARRLGVSAYLWIASVGIDEGEYEKMLRDFIARYRIKPIEPVLAECRKDIAEGRKVVVATGAGREMTEAFMQRLGLLEHVQLVTSQSRRFLGGMVSAVQCNGETKLRQLIKQGHIPPYLRAYSDTASDLPLLLAANEPILVNASPGDREKCRRLCRNLVEKY